MIIAAYTLWLDIHRAELVRDHVHETGNMKTWRTRTFDRASKTPLVNIIDVFRIDKKMHEVDVSSIVVVEDKNNRRWLLEFNAFHFLSIRWLRAALLSRDSVSISLMLHGWETRNLSWRLCKQTKQWKLWYILFCKEGSDKVCWLIKEVTKA